MAGIDVTMIHAVVFDTDGVVTDTAKVHAAAWKRVFDAFIQDSCGPGAPRFDIRADYLPYVDGRPRRDGVRAFLASRGITLPEGRPSDPPGTPTVHGLSRAKDELFVRELERRGVAVFPSTVTLVRGLRDRGCRTGVVSASRHCRQVLTTAGVVGLFDVLVDGNDAALLGLPGKPDPALFLEAAARLGVSPEETAIVEDALSGVRAGRCGAFKLVIAVDRGGQADALKAAGADVVVTDLAALTIAGSSRGAR